MLIKRGGRVRVRPTCEPAYTRSRSTGERRVPLGAFSGLPDPLTASVRLWREGESAWRRMLGFVSCSHNPPRSAVLSRPHTVGPAGHEDVEMVAELRQPAT